MKIILTSVGTRGDMEPFLAIGEMLKEKGHRVICAFPEQFGHLPLSAGLEFASLGSGFIDLLNSAAGKAAMGGATGFKKTVGILKLSLKQIPANKELLYHQQRIIEGEKPDRILYNGKTVYPMLWELNNKGKTIFISPLPYMHYVKGHSHVAFNRNFGDVLNRLSFSLAHFGMVTTLKISKRWLKIKDKIRCKAIRDVLLHNKSIYTISPALFKRPDYWHENLKVLGYHESTKKTDWQPDEALTGFLEKHDKILFISFGSMINPSPEKKTGMILDILRRHKIPAIINTASGGLVRPDTYDRGLIHFVSSIPYEQIFPKVYAVMHHGGSGTTHLGLKYGCATLIIPHIIDQFVWNTIIAEKGLGPKGIRIGKISRKSLEPMIFELMNNPDYRKKAEQIKQRMDQEDLKEKLYKTIIE